MKKIILGVSGALSAGVIPAYLLLMKAKYKHAHFEVIQTTNAQYFLSPGAIRHFPNVTLHTCFDNLKNQAKSHMNIVSDADIFIVAPATASFIAKSANGHTDDLLSLCFLAASCEKIVMPAMNFNMYAAKPVQRNLKQLEMDGCHILGPRQGISAQSGEIGEGAIEEPQKLIALIESIVGKL